jgi:dienelactone hydrolase
MAVRCTGAGPLGVVCVNGGRAAPVPGTWSASIEWLVRRLAPRLPECRFAEVRYRVKSWTRLDDCIEDAREAIEAVERDRIVLLGFSMGGAVAVACADDPRVDRVVGLAPWLFDQLSVAPIAGKRLRVLHGALDRGLPGIPGVAPALSRRGFDRAIAAGATGEYTTIRGAAHAIALRAPTGRPVPLPRARTWSRLVEAELRSAVR